jgi:hypothetical protein
MAKKTVKKDTSDLADLQRKVTALVKTFTREIKAEGNKCGIILDVAVKISEQTKESIDGNGN